jgi:hypothetical protein
MAIQDAGSISEEFLKAKAPYLISTESINPNRNGGSVKSSERTSAHQTTADAVTSDIELATVDGLRAISRNN